MGHECSDVATLISKVQFDIEVNVMGGVSPVLSSAVSCRNGHRFDSRFRNVCPAEIAENGNGSDARPRSTVRLIEKPRHKASQSPQQIR